MRILIVLVLIISCLGQSCKSYSKRIPRQNSFIGNSIQNLESINNLEDPNKKFPEIYFGNPNVKFTEIRKTDKELLQDEEIGFLLNIKMGEIIGPYKSVFNTCIVYKKVNGDQERRSAKIRYLVRMNNKNFPSIKNTTLDSLREIITKTNNFPELARDYSQDIATSKNKGDMGWVYEGDIIKELEMKSKEFGVNEIFEVETYFGFIFARLEEPWEMRKINTFIKVNFDDCD